jgi:hypothetical protein
VAPAPLSRPVSDEPSLGTLTVPSRQEGDQLRVQSRRQMAVLAAALAAILALDVVGPAATIARNPTELERFMAATADVESHGSHTALNPDSGAYGRYQIMPDNWRNWARRYLGDADAKPTPRNQERVAKAKMVALYRWLGSWRRVSYWWLTGSSRTSAWSRPASQYVARVMAVFGVERDEGEANERHYSEQSSTITYAGSWRGARSSGYAGGSVRYATKAGDTASIAFTGRRIEWYGPVGPTRGVARIILDGVAQKPIRLTKSTFRPRMLVYSHSWKTSGRHTLVVEVLETKGHKLVAIDELVVTP